MQVRLRRMAFNPRKKKIVYFLPIVKASLAG